MKTGRIGLVALGSLALLSVPAHAITGVLCIKANGKGTVKVRNPTCKSSEVQVGSFDTATPQANLTDVSVQVKLQSDVTIPTAIGMKVPFGPGSEIFDTHHMHDEVVNPTRLTAPIPGKYFVYASVLWKSGGTGSYRSVVLLVSGAAAPAASVVPPPTGGATATAAIATQVELAAGDYVELHAEQDSGGPLDVWSPLTEFGMAKVP